MSTGITLEELLAWNEEVADFWKAHLAAHPDLLELPCNIGGAGTVKEFVRHIWGAELRWSQRLAGVPVTEFAQMPTGPLDAVVDLHTQAAGLLRGLLAGPDQSWEQTYELNAEWLPPEARSMSRRKVVVHALTHGHRHWAQLATVVRMAGFPSGFKGDLLFSRGMR